MAIYTAALGSLSASQVSDIRPIAQGIAPILQMEEAGGREVLPQEAFGRAK